jgi:mono/diheme cytochrome c family protein
MLLFVTVVGMPAGASRNVTTSTINVTVGNPSEISVSFSKSSLIPPGSVIFKVKNLGKLAHTFKVCLSPAGGTANSCLGKSVSLAKSGLTGTLTLTLKKGKYEFLSTVSGQTVAGLKGLIGVGLTVPKATSVIPKASTGGTTTTGKTTTTPTTTGAPDAPAPGFPVGTASAGAPLFASSGCGGCHTLAAAGSSGTAGPNLDMAKPVVALVEFRVKNGGLDMPPFGDSLSTQQIADLATYVYRSTH